MSQVYPVLASGWLGKLPSLGYLQTVAGLDLEKTAALCGVAPDTVRRWRSDRTPPLYAFRLLAVMAGYVPWRGWDGWFYNPFDQTLNHPDLKDGFGPDRLGEWLFQRTEKPANNSLIPADFVTYPIYRQGQGAGRPLRGRRRPRKLENNTSQAAYGRPPFGLSGRNVHRLRKRTMVGQGGNTDLAIHYAK